MSGGDTTRRRWPPTRPPSSGSKRAAATAGATTCSPCCAASASTPSSAERPLSTFSGGELTRASLARALAARPDLLLLDEPTNHLDIPSLEWLEGYLVELDAAVVLVAHDRWFLEAVGTSVLELEAAARPLLRRPLARLAPGAGGAPDRPRQGDRAPAGRDRADGALRRALPLQGDEGQPGAVAGQADRQEEEGRAGRPNPATPATCASPSNRRSGPAGSC